MRRGARAAHVLVRLAALAPLAGLAWGAYAGRLGANPIEAVTHETGQWTLRFLLASLAITPVRRLAGWSALAPYRRTFGLLGFFYASLHLLTYLWLDQFFDWGAMAKDIGKRPFITAGFLAYGLLVPLALTSTAGAARRLGGVAWRRLHRLAYAAAALGVLHYWWLVKLDTRPPLAHGAVLAALLAARLVPARRR